MTRFHVFGDSWSLYSYNKLPNFVETVGKMKFENMFDALDMNCANHSQPGSSNKQILACMADQKFVANDIAIVFQTDPLRDLVDRKNFKILQKPNQSKDFLNVVKQCLHDFYQQLANLQVSVLLIGGLSCIDHDAVPKTLWTIEQSWTELACPGFKDCYFEWIEFTELAHNVLQCKDSITSITQQIAAKNAVWHNSDLFGWCHPSDAGYKMMFSHIISFLSNKGEI